MGNNLAPLSLDPEPKRNENTFFPALYHRTRAQHHTVMPGQAFNVFISLLSMFIGDATTAILPPPRLLVFTRLIRNSNVWTFFSGCLFGFSFSVFLKWIGSWNKSGIHPTVFFTALHLTISYFLSIFTAYNSRFTNGKCLHPFVLKLHKLIFLMW